MAMKKISSPPEGLKVTNFIKRPSLGNQGREIRVRANFFEVTSLPEANIHHYDITITPEVPPSLNRKVYQEFEELNSKSNFNNILPVFDGRKNIFTFEPLPFKDSATFDIILPEDDGSTSTKRQPRAFKIKLKKVNEINMKELQRFLNGKGQCTSNVLTAIMALDVLIKHKPSMKYVPVGRSFYTREGSKSLFGSVEVWQGYYQSARPTPGKMMINIDLCATAFYESGPLINVIVKLLEKRNPDDLRKGINERERVKLEKELKNLKIRVTHRGSNNAKRRYKISKITLQDAQRTKFDDADGHTTDVASYFQKTYKRLNYPHLPCVVVKKDNFLPMEICEVIEGQRYLRKLNERQTADMIKFTCQPPNIRANKIKMGLDTLNYRDNEQMTQFKMKVSNDMAIVQARVLPIPTINYNASSKDATFAPKDGVWNLRYKKVVNGATLGSWSVLVFGSDREFPIPSVQRFVRELITTCSDTGMNIPNKTPPILHANPQGNVEESLKQAWIRAGNAANLRPQLVLCVLPNTGIQLYGSIKRASDTIIGVVTQCIQSKHMMQAGKQYCANVCLKINVKLGGMNSFLSPKQNPFLHEKPSILMGADVTHPPPGSSRPSIAALCASMDDRASRYAASIRRQTSRTEIISELANMVKDMLKTFYQTSGKKPERILFYRDGVSEGQFEQVLKGEIKAVKSACQSLDPKYSPTITFVIVQKRHHARFFPIDKRDTDRTGNCLPGTIVETGVVHPVEFDFYLQSQAGLQGTCRPTHYHVLYDENKFTPDSLQTLSYNLCYIYARCTRVVSLVPPVYYAHLVCSRARFHINGDNFNEESSTEGDIEVAYGDVKPELLKVMYFM
ncbi:Piwi domain-containing protein [Glomus cerebriforme]|uniref:Piwi domain-containing protein n=1 Tax=Glomus cerebriforme TaxID=658196 RepID=A0A397SDW2_9GLOM|nr:Piwi domain-containing protein [Glomus cerebriforme]